MREYQLDRKWSNQFNDHIIEILEGVSGCSVARLASDERDMKTSTDLLLFTTRQKPIHIAARVRRREYIKKYPNDITIRYRRGNGATTEWEKVFKYGFGHWYFYGFESSVPNRVDPWMILDLRIWRGLFVETVDRERIRKAVRTGVNSDHNRTKFLAFDSRILAEINPEIVVMESSRYIKSNVIQSVLFKSSV